MKRTDIQFLSPREPVHMADEWFGLISADHFWFKRRFEVFRKFAGNSVAPCLAPFASRRVALKGNILIQKSASSVSAEIWPISPDDPCLQRNDVMRSQDAARCLVGAARPLP